MNDIDSRMNTPGFSPAERFAAMSPLGLAMSRDRVLIWVNERFAAMFGFSTQELAGQSFAVLFPSEAEFKRIGLRMQTAMLGCGTYQDERLMRRRDGRLQWIRVHGHATDPTEPFREAAWVFETMSTGVEPDTLTPREREVLAALTAGLTAKECAKSLGISPRTVEKLSARLRQHYGVHTSAGLIARVLGMP